MKSYLLALISRRMFYIPDRKTLGVRDEAVSYRWLLHCLLRRLNPANCRHFVLLLANASWSSVTIIFCWSASKSQLLFQISVKLFIDIIQKWAKLIICPLSTILTMCMWRGKMIPNFSCGWEYALMPLNL